MSRVFCPLSENGIVKDRIIFDSYEMAASIMGDIPFVEETEETGPIYVNGFWNGAICIHPESLVPTEE